MKSVSSSSSFNFLKLSGFCGAQKQHMRVADILISDDDDDIDGYDYGDRSIMVDGRRRREGCRIFECVSPRVILSRWLSLLRRSRERRGVVQSERREKEGGELGDGSMRTNCSMNCLSGESSSSLMLEGCKRDSEVVDESGWYRKESSFNLGVGFGLIFLITASKNELNKMMELRTEMEMLLQNVKEELRRKDALSKLSESSDNLAYSTTDVKESLNTNGHLSLQNYMPSLILPDLETTMVREQTLRYDMSREEECVEGMDQLEAELETELERLQLHLDTEYLSKHPQQQRIEVAVEDTAPEGSLSTSFGEVVDPHEAGTGEHFGVPPNELERRLHELLEARQEEQIKELEAALESSKRELREKEIEVSWWKDTAKLISQRVPETSRLISQHVMETSHMSR